MQVIDYILLIMRHPFFYEVIYIIIINVFLR